MDSSDDCLAEEVVLDYLSGSLDTQVAAYVDEHIDTCVQCRCTLAEMVRPAAISADRLVVEQPGRYTLRRTFGRGAQGVIMLAFDDTIGREVALKLLTTRDGDKARVARFLREARVAGQLNHPNIVQVYELGRRGDGTPYYTMQLVRGQTLAQVIGASESVAERLALLDHFVAVCNAVGYAQSRGVVHRDVKPQNIMVGKFGETVLLDWGLAKLAVGGANDPDAQGAEPQVMDSEGVDETVVGTTVGTPAYMSPEQARGDISAVDCLSDVFCLGSVLFELASGKPPFKRKEKGKPGRVLRDLQQTAGAVPAPLVTIIRKAMAEDKADRYSSASELAQEVRRFQADRLVAAHRYSLSLLVRRWLRRNLAFSVSSAAIGLVVVVMFMVARSGVLSQLCVNLDAPLQGVWDADRRTDMRRAFLRTKKSYAAETYGKVSALLDAYASSWVAAREDACEDTHYTGEQSARFLDLRMACLGTRLEALSALVQVLAKKPDVEVLGNAVDASASLPGLDRCTDIAALTAVVPPPEESAVEARVARVRRDIARGAASYDAGLQQAAEAIWRSALAEAEDMDYPPLTARVLSELSRLLIEKAHTEEAQTTLLRAFHQAALARDDSLTATLWLHQLRLVGLLQSRREVVEDLLPLAEAAQVRARVDPADRWRMRRLRGLLAIRAGDYHAANAHAQAAVHGFRDVFGADHPTVGESLSDLADTYAELADFERAHETYLDALAIAERSYGAHHPSLVPILTGLGGVAKRLQTVAMARQFYRRALDIAEDAHGPTHRALAGPLNGLATLDARQEDFVSARRRFEQVLEIDLRFFPADHPNIGDMLSNLGAVTLEAGDPQAAVSYFSRALEVSSARGPHPRVASYLSNLGEALLEIGRLQAAEDAYKRAEEIWVTALGEDHPMVSHALVGLGRIYVARRRWDDAAGVAARAYPVVDATGDRYLQAHLLLVRAQVLMRGGAPTPSTKGLVRQAIRRIADLDRQPARTLRAQAQAILDRPN